MLTTSFDILVVHVPLAQAPVANVVSFEAPGDVVTGAAASRVLGYRIKLWLGCKIFCGFD